jgi:hypothetical protein
MPSFPRRKRLGQDYPFAQKTKLTLPHGVQKISRIIQVDPGFQAPAAEGREDYAFNRISAAFFGRQGKAQSVLDHLAQGTLGLRRQLLGAAVKTIVDLEGCSHA